MNTALPFYIQDTSDEYIPDYAIPDRPIVPDDDGSTSEKDDLGLTATDKKPSKDPIRLVPPLDPLRGSFKKLQEWVGRVLEINEAEFSAIITDKTNPDVEDQVVTIDSNDITPDEITLLKRGAVFYWSVGFSDYPGRGRSRESRIRFRRLMGPLKADIARSEKMGKELAQFFASNSTCSAKL